ncbi:MAG: TolB family protein, partial [Planctomycetota bacterium JB042]
GLTRMVENPDAYLAECVIRADGRYLVFCEHVVEEGKSGGDLVVMDLEDGRQVPVTVAAGYDGGPFFSPEGERICYRSDRRGNDLLQIFVSELAFDHAGNVLGVDREFQLTDNAHVNWAPFWHPSGRYLVYATSEMGHENYEVFLVDADPGAEDRPTKYGTRRRRVTHAAGFDGLPVFDADGTTMMWTSQRAPDGSSQVWAAEFVMDLEPAEPGDEPPPADEPSGKPDRLHLEDPVTGLYFVYDPATHELTMYDPRTHEVRKATAEEAQRAMKLFAEQRGKKGG